MYAFHTRKTTSFSLVSLSFLLTGGFAAHSCQFFVNLLLPFLQTPAAALYDEALLSMHFTKFLNAHLCNTH